VLLILGVVVCCRGGVPLYLYKSIGGASKLFLAEAGLHHLSMEACHCHVEGEAKRHQEGSDRSLTELPCHRLCMPGLGLDMDQCPRVLCLI
jgi:hypothetical protein